MDLFAFSEFADEYQEWLQGLPCAGRAGWLDIPVAQLEPRPVLAVQGDTSVRDAVMLMSRHDHGAVLVLSRERLIGIFTERDVVRRVIAERRDLEHTEVRAVMTPDPDTLEPTATLAQALRTMARARYRHLPVVGDGGRPIAVVSMRRIIEFVGETFPREVWNAPPERPSGIVGPEGA